MAIALTPVRYPDLVDGIVGGAIGLAAGFLIGLSDVATGISLVTAFLGFGASLIGLRLLAPDPPQSAKIVGFALGIIIGIVVGKIFVANDYVSPDLKKIQGRFEVLGFDHAESRQLAASRYFGRPYSELGASSNSTDKGCAIMSLAAAPLNGNIKKMLADLGGPWSKMAEVAPHLPVVEQSNLFSAVAELCGRFTPSANAASYLRDSPR